MRKSGRLFYIVSLAALLSSIAPASALVERVTPKDVLQNWYALSLELVRHTPTYTPPVASRALAYLGITAYEVTASGRSDMASLAGQLNQLKSLPVRAAGMAYDEAVVLEAALSVTTQSMFANTGPTGQRALSKLAQKLNASAAQTLAPDVVARSEVYGRSVAEHILIWAQSDGGAVVENLGFAASGVKPATPGDWIPTNVVALQQAPLLPNWGKNRPFAMPSGATCPLPGPPAYSEDKTSVFYQQALEVVEVKKSLTPEQKAIARFWSDDAMLTPTPPGHWTAIALQIIARDDLDINKSADVLARLGVAMADAFIGCWDAKFDFNLLRPLTYVRRVIDPKWDSLLNTPPFPEYPSGHSTQSGAAALVLTKIFGENFAFEDATHAKDGIKPRSYPSFEAAAQEAGISRLYGGIHYRAAIDDGLNQGRCIGAFANALKTRT